MVGGIQHKMAFEAAIRLKAYTPNRLEQNDVRNFKVFFYRKTFLW
jgi:hypothetical protein